MPITEFPKKHPFGRPLRPISVDYERQLLADFCLLRKAKIGQERPVTIGKAGPKAAADNFLLKHVLLAYVF